MKKHGIIYKLFSWIRRIFKKVNTNETSKTQKKYYKRKVKGDLYEEIHKNHTCNFNYNHDSNMHNVCN